MSKAPLVDTTNKGECVKVMVRCRPFNSKEKNNGSKNCIDVVKDINQIVLTAADNVEDQGRGFTYDAVYGEASTQREVYDEGAFHLVESVMQGYNGTIFAYGQTGCGKTHTMIGVKGDKSQNGIIPNAFDHIFSFFDDAQNMKKKFLIRCSYLEIYNETIRDLLSKDISKSLEIKENKDSGIFVKDLTTCIVKTIPEIEAYMDHGTAQRMTGETAMNATSSRSHSIFTIYIETAERDEAGEQRVKAGKLNLVDLAGSERQSKTQATGARLKEATQINLSLSALGNVINAMVEGKTKHIPYRDSKLTRLLQDSLGGNTKTVMIAAISPADYNFEETLTTLRYASRAKNIKNKPRINMDPKDALLKQYEEEIQKLRQIIEDSKKGHNIKMDLGQSMKMLNKDQSISNKNSVGEETVEQLLAKLAKRGKKVKLLDESASVKELPKQEDLDEDLDRDEAGGDEFADIQTANIPVGIQGSTKKKMSKIVEERDEESEKKLKEEHEKQAQIIEQTNQQLQQEAQKRDELERILGEMEQRMVQGGNALEEKEKEKAHEQRLLQIQLDEEKQKQVQILEEKEIQEQLLLEKDAQYANVNEELADGRKIIKKLRAKLKNANNELKDIHQENAERNEELLDTVREQAKELDFLNQMVKFLMTDEQIYKIKSKTEWDEEQRHWKLPPFIIKSKEIQLPTLGNAKQFVQEELENQDVQFTGSKYSDANATPNNENHYGQNIGNSAQRKTNGFRKESRNGQHRGLNNKNTNSNAYISPLENNAQNGNPTSQRGQADFKMSRNDSKSSNNFTNQQIKNQQNRIMRLNNDNYIMDSPDVNHRKLNSKVGVQLAPIGAPPPLGAARASMMSIKAMEGEQEGTESHPILRAHNYKKPTLEKLIHPGQGGGMQPQQNQGININMQNIGSNNTNGNIQMTFQATVSIDNNQVMSSKKMHGRKRDTAQLAPLSHPPAMGGNHSQMSQNQ